MAQKVLVTWQAKEYDFTPKSSSWYWTVSIIAVGVAAAAGITGNYLFSVIAVLGGFTLMLVGSRRPGRHIYKLTEHGLVIGTHLIPYDKMQRFALSEDEPRTLTIETTLLMGTIKIHLTNADFRAIRTVLKNNNIDEEDELDLFFEKVASSIGL